MHPTSAAPAACCPTRIPTSPSTARASATTVVAYAKPQPLGEERFLEKIRSRKGADYDCVLGISGGKDSCYVAYLAKKKYGLRALAVTYDFPFMVDLARQNIKTVCDNLGLELLVVKSSNDLEYDLMRNHLTSLAATGTTWGQCMFCHYGIEAILDQHGQEQRNTVHAQRCHRQRGVVGARAVGPGSSPNG